MTYQPLARKYRPDRFADLIGQDAVSIALRNAIQLNREPAAVIFYGIRGVGKTTSARLYAKALNCQQRVGGEPCNQCADCDSIRQGCHEDVLEIDGASNNGVDEIRALRETTSYIPQRSRYKVYIIDEVHMLSLSAFNALLKILEEPPPAVVFIFATTELQKVPKTVVSRCLTFNLNAVPTSLIYQRLEAILRTEGVAYEAAALNIVAREGRGSLRDALTFLDQIIALGDGQITAQALTALGMTLSSTQLLRLLRGLLNCDGEGTIQRIDALAQSGVTWSKAALELIQLIRHAFVLQQLKEPNIAATLKALALEESDAQDLLDIARSVPALDLHRLFRHMMQCQAELDDSILDRFVFENYGLEWCLGRDAESVSGNVPDARRKERKSGVDVRETPVPRSAAATVAAPSSIPQPTQQTAPKERFPATWTDLLTQWKVTQPIQARKLEDAHLLVYGPERIAIAVDPNSMMGPTLLQRETQKKIEQIFKDLFDFRGTFEASAKSASTSAQVLQETPLEVREREQRAQAEQSRNNANNHPLTKSILDSFQGRIVRTDLC